MLCSSIKMCVLNSQWECYKLCIIWLFNSEVWLCYVWKVQVLNLNIKLDINCDIVITCTSTNSKKWVLFDANILYECWGLVVSIGIRMICHFSIFIEKYIVSLFMIKYCMYEESSRISKYVFWRGGMYYYGGIQMYIRGLFCFWEML